MRSLNISLIAAGLFCIWTPLSQAASFVIVNTADAAGFGFNDTTVVAPVGGNAGTTLGQQRLNVLQEACDIWGAYLSSPVNIRVQVQSNYDPGTSGGLTLASAGPLTIHRDFLNAPLPGVLYPAALANSISGSDLSSANDIQVNLNVALDAEPSLPDWYYGLDGNTPGSELNLLDTLLHELGHGLGMISLVSLSTGSFYSSFGPPRPDVYSLLLYDTETSAAWGDMTSQERLASSINDPNLVWTGPYTTAAQGEILAQARVINVTAPISIAGEFQYEAAAFGPALPAIPEGGITGPLIIANDGTAPTTDACEIIQNDLTGAIAYIDRGSCNFDSKVAAAEAAGALAVIIANNVADPEYIIMSGNGSGIGIPAVSISQADGLTLTGASPGVVLTLGAPTSTGLAGTNGGYVRIYAPNPVEGGSSVSHWSTAASPDLLMEPFATPLSRDDLDLSLTQMKDIGWTVLDIPFPHFNYDLWVTETFSPAATLTAQGEDPDGDGITNIEEYFYGGNPEAPSTGVLPVMQLVEPNLNVVYTRSKLPADLAFTYEISPDLSTWTVATEGSGYIDETVAPLSFEAEQVTLALDKPAPSEKVFIRLRIVQP
jgi:hypothetical protein